MMLLRQDFIALMQQYHPANIVQLIAYYILRVVYILVLGGCLQVQQVMYSLVLVQECVIVTAVSCDPLLSRVILHCRYTAGDHIAIYPENDVELVDRIAELLEVNLDQVFSLVNKDGVLCVCVAMCMCSVQAYVCVCVHVHVCVCVSPFCVAYMSIHPTDQVTKKHPFPCPTTYHHAILHYVDITSLTYSRSYQSIALARKTNNTSTISQLLLTKERCAPCSEY